MRLLSLSAFLPIVLSACSGTSPSSGRGAAMRVDGAQFVSGSLDTKTESSSPEVHSVALSNNDLYPGVTGKSISGTVGPGTTGVLIGLAGDDGHWVVPVQDIDQTIPGDFAFSVHASFSPDTPAMDGGALTLVVRATDKDGNVGPAWLTDMNMQESRPQGALVISLDWDTQADLDLHVAIPSDMDAGVNEIWSRKPSALPLGTRNATVEDGVAAGYLDFDSNSQCAGDGRRVENVIFPTTAPGGHYVVRVDTFSLCGEVVARYRVRVFTHDSATPVLTAYGQSSDLDTRFAHGQGAGLQVLSFDFAQ
jgi:hypothetical protein